MPTATQQKTEFRLSFHAAFGQIDQEKGKMADVSLMTEGEALGHGCWCDQKTLQSVFALAQKSPVKAYLTHGDFFQPDRLGDEVGLFSGLYLEKDQLKAKQFSFFKSFMGQEKQKYEALMELAQADASLFGVSLSFSGKLVWVLADGSEVSADSDEIPEGATRDMPSVRVTRIYSADFVSDPAANPNGLFDVRLQAAAKLLGISLPALRLTATTNPNMPTYIESPGAGLSSFGATMQSLEGLVTITNPFMSASPSVDATPNSETKTIFTMIKEIRAKFNSEPLKFARACELLAENEKITVAEIEVKLNAEAELVRVKQLEADVAKAKADIAERDTKIADLEKKIEAAAKGADPIKLGNASEGANNGAAIVEEWNKLSGAAASAFWEKNQAAIRAYKVSGGK